MALPSDSTAKAATFINIRKLAALDLFLHPQWLIVTEFAVAVCFAVPIGLLLLYVGIFNEHLHSLFTVVLGGWMVCLALNYLPLLLYAISIVRRKSAHAEIAVDLASRDTFTRKYTLQSLLLVLPLIVPILALSQEIERRRV